jgi:hypothetical protein
MKRRSLGQPSSLKGEPQAPHEQLATRSSFAERSPNGLTLHPRSVALPDNVRDLLDWLIDEELKRWQRETR